MRRFGDRDYVLEEAIKGELALVRADTSDLYGNLTFRYAQVNFGPAMATAASLVVAEVRAVVDRAHRSGARAIARRVRRSRRDGVGVSAMQPLNRRQMAWRAAQDIDSGLLVNLGMGMPVHVADYLRPEVDVFIQAENGVIGAGPLAAPEHADPDLVDASSRRITLRPAHRSSTRPGRSP